MLLQEKPNMTFKQNWEKTDEQHQLPAGMIENMVSLAYPHKKLISYEIISGGCANLNIKINIAGDKQPLVLRLYLRDKDAAYREQELGVLLKQNVPVPLTHYINDWEDYRFAITEFIPGITLRDLLLSPQPHDIGSLMYEVGVLLARFTTYTFPKAGFLDKDLNIIESTSQDSYLAFAKKCLQSKNVVTQLSVDNVSKINFYLEKYSHLFPGEDEKHLVHADFDPSNILVDKASGVWKVTAILDWEFAFSGSVLCDIANMLRYAHQVSPLFEKSFLQGLNISLPEHWRIIIYMLNLVSLLDCLVRADPKNRPNQYTDICDLISFYVERLEEVTQ